MTNVKMDVKPSGVESGIVSAPFDQALDALSENGLDLIGLPQNAALRIEQGKDAYISQNGNWVREGVIYTPKGTPRLVRNSPILMDATTATQAHREGKEFYPNGAQLSQSMGQKTDSVEFPERNMKIPTKRFGSEALTVFAFGGEREAQAYGEFLQSAGIAKMPVYATDEGYVNEQAKPFARQLWFGGLDDRSYLYGDGSRLNYVGRARGVRSVSGEARARGSEVTDAKGELYSPAQIQTALKGLQLTGLEAQLLGRLRTK